MENFIVYVHRNPQTKEIFYVGIASRRDRAHYFRNRNSHWRGYVAKYGEPIVEILYANLFKYEVEIIEKFMITTMGRKGYEPAGVLVNQSTGGGLNMGWKMPEHAREKIIIALKNREASPEHVRRMVENNPSKRPEVREKIRLSKLGGKHSAETIAKLSKNSSARRPEVAAKISRALTGRVGKLNACSKAVIQIDKLGSVVAEHESIMQAAKAVNGDFRLLSAVCRGKRKYHMGFSWKYA